jgi:hypothetical protein
MSTTFVEELIDNLFFFWPRRPKASKTSNEIFETHFYQLWLLVYPMEPFLNLSQLHFSFAKLFFVKFRELKKTLV